MWSFIKSTVIGRVTGLMILFAIGGIVVLLSGNDGEGPRTENQKIQDQIDRSTDDVDAAADAAGRGLQVYDAQNTLMVNGDLDRYRIQRLERSEEGDLVVFTKMPSNAASKKKGAKLCEKLIGSDPPLVDVTDFVLVFGQGTEHIRADECDIQHWQGA